MSVSDSWPGGCEFDYWLRRLSFAAYFCLSPLQKHVRKVVVGFVKKSCVSTGVTKQGNTYCVSDHHMTLAVKVVLNSNPTNQHNQVRVKKSMIMTGDFVHNYVSYEEEEVWKRRKFIMSSALSTIIRCLEYVDIWHGGIFVGKDRKHFGKRCQCGISSAFFLSYNVFKGLFSFGSRDSRVQRIHSSARIYEYKIGKDEWYFWHGCPAGRVITNLISYFCIPAMVFRPIFL